MAWKIIQRNKGWVAKATVVESYNSENDNRRFTATICGFQNWLIYEGPVLPGVAAAVVIKVREIRNLIEAGDKGIFKQKGPFLKSLEGQG